MLGIEKDMNPEIATERKKPNQIRRKKTIVKMMIMTTMEEVAYLSP